MSKTLKDIIKHPSLIYQALGALGLLKCVKDEKYLKRLYKIRMGKKLDLDNPKTYNEKLQWLKIYDRKPIYTKMVDKAEAKKIVAEKIGEEYITPTLGVYEKWNDIDFDVLPDSFVIKCTHDSGGLVIVKDKNNFDKKAAKKLINRHLKLNFYNSAREWAYKDVKPRIIIEKFIDAGDGKSPADYKFFCFDGKVKALFVATDRPYDTRFDFFDENFNHLPIINGFKLAEKQIEKPQNFEKMKELAERLSEGFCHVRVDFYNIEGRIKFGEFTFYHHSGIVAFKPEEWDYKFGEWIKLPERETK
ncbi:MAG: ATP-grasp fold amidoligase family protein [Clostridia bacterium]|nr:ATP-grasp fold amidoligase family protein [Clostridia bacterium]